MNYIKELLRKNKKVVIIAGIAILLIAAIIITITAVSCAKNTLNEESADAIVKADWQRVIHKTEESQSDINEELIGKFISSSDELTESVSASDITEPKYLSLLDQKSSFTLDNMKKEDGYYVLTYLVTYPNVGGTLDGISNSDISAIDAFSADDYLSDAISNSDLCTSQAAVLITYENDTYKVIYSEEFMDYMYGGLYSYSMRMINELYLSSDSDIAKEEGNAQ